MYEILPTFLQAPKRTLDSFIAQMPTKVIDASCFTETSKK